jgi:hypothetical protein
VTVSNDHKRVIVEARLDGVSGSVSAVLPFQSAIEFGEDTDSKTTRGSKLIAKIAGKILDSKNSAAGRMTTTI